MLNLGGGYKVARMSHEKGTTLQTDCAVVKEVFEEFAKTDEHHRKVSCHRMPRVRYDMIC